MKRIVLATMLAATPAYADSPVLMSCQFDNGQLFETISLGQGNTILVRWDGKGEWKKGFARFESPNLIVRQITNAGSFVLVWDVKAGHGAHGWTKNDSGRNSDGAAYCWFK